MAKIQFSIFLLAGLGTLCTSCTLTKECTFEQVLQHRSYTGSKLYGDYYTFYCGSDEKYDYYSCISCFPAQHFKVKTTPKLFYPAPVPFKGWLLSECYMFDMYRGRIVIKSREQDYQLSVFRNEWFKQHYDKPAVSPRRKLEETNAWCIANWGSDRLRIPDAKTGYAQPEWSYLRSTYKPPYTPQRTSDFNAGDDPRF